MSCPDDPPTHDSEHQHAAAIEKYGQCPEKIAQALKDLHNDPQTTDDTRSSSVRGFIEALSPCCKTTAAKVMRSACTTRLPETLLEIVLDSRLYMWHDPTSSLYNPALGVSSILHFHPT